MWFFDADDQALHLSQSSGANEDSSLPMAWPYASPPGPVLSSSTGAYHILHTSPFPGTNASNDVGSAGSEAQVAGLLIPARPGPAAELVSPVSLTQGQQSFLLSCIEAGTIFPGAQYAAFRT